MNKTAAACAAIAVITLGLSGCETATPYQPLVRGSSTSGGYYDQRLDEDHFRVSFQGNTVTPRATVETYLLYRAAELTVSQGYDWFETEQRHTDKDQQTYYEGDPFYGPGYGYGFGYFRPAWTFYGGGGFGRGFGRGFLRRRVHAAARSAAFGDGQIQTVQKFQATAEIVMHKGPKPAGRPPGLRCARRDREPQRQGSAPDDLECQLVQPQMVVRAPTERPSEQSIHLVDGFVVDAGDTPGHQTPRIELPKLVTVGSKPSASDISALVDEAHRHAVLTETPDLLDQPILPFALPLAGEKGADLRAAVDELCSVAPTAFG